jgi:DNA-binding CsgD family transcriptional regulator
MELWEYTLSPQQKVILQKLRNGESYRSISSETGISEATIKQQARRIREKKLKVTGDRVVNKSDTLRPQRSPSVLFETPLIRLDGDTSKVIGGLEKEKGLSITPLQKEIIACKIAGKRPKEIAAALGISPEEVESGLEQIRTEIRRIQYDAPSDGPGPCEYLPGGLTVNEAQVLYCINNGMSVKGTADKLGKSENAVRKTMSRADVSMRKVRAERQEGPRFKTNHYIPPDPGLSLLRYMYFTGQLDSKAKVISAELILRSAGLIKSVPAIRQSNAQILNVLSSKGKRIFHASLNDNEKLNQYVHGLRGSILDYAGASLVMMNRYAKEEESSEGSSFVHTYAVDEKFWAAIMATVVAPGSDNESNAEMKAAHAGEDRIDSGSRVVLRLVETDETLKVSMPGFDERPGAEVGEGFMVMSPRAPLTIALYGRKAGERLAVAVGKVRVEYEVLKVI